MSYFYENEELFYSAACSDNIYRRVGERPSFQRMLGQELLIELQHIKSKEQYLCCSFRSLSAPRDAFYLNAASKPMHHGFIWPVDVVISRNEKFLVFKARFSHDRSFVDLLSYTAGDYAGFETPGAKKLISDFLALLSNLYGNGYVYRLWDERKLYLGEQTQELIFQFNDALSAKSNPMHLEQEAYYTELTDPYIYNGDKDYDFYSEMYSYQSLLFKLLIGIYPFEGERMVGLERNGTETELGGWKLEYLRPANTIFVFDDYDTRNQIGVMGQDVPRVNRWRSLPPKVQDMFKNVFTRSNVLRENGDILYYMPEQWMEALGDFDYQVKV